MNGKEKFEKILLCYLDYEKNNKNKSTKNGLSSRKYYFILFVLFQYVFILWINFKSQLLLNLL